MLQRHEQLAFPGSIHFVTTVTRARGTFFVAADHCQALLELFEWYRRKFAVDCLGYCLMPDHFHVLLHQSQHQPVIPALLRDFKKLSARRCCPPDYPAPTLWHDRYDDVPVPGTNAVRTKLAYLHQNPVRKGLVTRAEDYPWSSARFYFINLPGPILITRPDPL